MDLFALFNKDRKAYVHRAIELPRDILQASLTFHHAKVLCQGSMQIDARMRHCHIYASKHEPIVVSAQAKMRACHVHGHDVVIEGDFAGELFASGDVALTASARIAGLIQCNGKVVIRPLVDARLVRIERTQQTVTSLPPQRPPITTSSLGWTTEHRTDPSRTRLPKQS